MQAVFWPLRYYSGWRLEKKFGMSKQTFSAWLADYFKAQALGLLFFVLSALVFFAVVQALPSHWWWILALISFGFSTFFSTLFPVVILPLFYKCPPLKEPLLAERLQRTLERCGLPGLPLYEIRLGEKTVRANAMVAGFAGTRRALLSDTLLKKYEPEEIEMVLAHEAGHAVLRHIARSLFYEAVSAFAGFYALFYFFGRTDLLSLGFFPVLLLVAHLAGLVALPFTNTLSRFHEKEADRFALERYPNLGVFRSLMEKLALHNLADPSPGRLEETLLYTHPSKDHRIAAAEKFLRMLLANSERVD